MQYIGILVCLGGSDLVILLPFGQSRTAFILNDQGMVCGGEFVI